jgi:hypothetical protein
VVTGYANFFYFFFQDILFAKKTPKNTNKIEAKGEIGTNFL